MLGSGYLKLKRLCGFLKSHCVLRPFIYFLHMDKATQPRLFLRQNKVAPCVIWMADVSVSVVLTLDPYHLAAFYI